MMFVSSKAASIVALVAVLATAVRAQRGGWGGGFGGGGFGGGGAVTACVTQYPTALSELTTFASTGDTSSNDLKCYMSCVLQAKGKMSTDGIIPFRGAPANMPAATATAITTCFSTTPNSNLCEAAYQHSKCLWTNDPNRLFLGLYQGGGGGRSFNG